MKKARKLRFFLISILLMIMLIGCGEGSDSGKVVSGGNGTGLDPAGTNKEDDDELGKVYILKEVNQATDQVLLVKVGGSYREYVYNYTGSTVMKDRYGKLLSESTLTYGEVFEIEVSDDGSKVLSMVESDNVWIFENVENFSLSMEDEMLKVGSEKYHLTDSTFVFDGMEQFTRYQLTEDDVLTLIGYKKELLAVMIETGHGTLQFVNTEGFEEGYFVLGNVAAAKIQADMAMDVRAGSFLLSVGHKGRGGSLMVTVEPGQTTTVDLSQFASNELKSSVVTIHVVQEGTVVKLNGNVIDTTYPLTLTYGTYRLTAELDGVDDWSRLLLVSSPTADVTIDMETVTATKKEETTTKPDADEDEEDAESNEDTENNDDEDDEEDDERNSIDNQTNTLLNEVLDVLVGD